MFSLAYSVTTKHVFGTEAGCDWRLTREGQHRREPEGTVKMPSVTHHSRAIFPPCAQGSVASPGEREFGTRVGKFLSESGALWSLR